MGTGYIGDQTGADSLSLMTAEILRQRGWRVLNTPALQFDRYRDRKIADFASR